MKIYDELTEEQKEKAVKKEMVELLEVIITGEIKFNDRLNKDGLQKRINTAAKKADDMRTPWFVHEYIMETCGDDIKGMATCTAEDALYSEQDEHVICGIV